MDLLLVIYFARDLADSSLGSVTQTSRLVDSLSEHVLKVFLSWSGERSHIMAQALRDWLPGVLQTTEPWLSSQDLVAGERWSIALTKALEETRLGIICLTKDNLNAGWLHFEAGALSKLSGGSLLCLYSLDVAPSDITGPLAQFQATRADKDGTLSLLFALNGATGGPSLSDANLRRAFELWWPQLQSLLSAIPGSSLKGSAATSLDEKIDKALGLLESLVANHQAATSPQPRGAGSNPPRPDASRRPRVFIGSSSEGLPIANAMQEILDPVAECTIWNQGVFAPSSTFIESLQDARLIYDCAIIVLPVMTLRRAAVTQPQHLETTFSLNWGYLLGRWVEHARFSSCRRTRRRTFPQTLPV